MAEVYAALKSLQNDLSETNFRRSLQQFMAWVKGISEKLAKCFEKEYAGRTREWAACFWVGSRANTNMFVERFHRMLKEVYLEKKQNRHVDHLLFKLRKIARDKAFEQLIKAEKGKNTVRQRESMKWHKQGELMKKEAVHKQDNDLWNVQLASKTGMVHHVRRISSACSCVLKCSSCDACMHTFECSCADYGIRGVLCSHIHSVNILYPRTIAPEVELVDTELEITSDNDIEKKCKNLSSLIQHDKKAQESGQLADLKAHALSQIAELSDLIQSAPTKDTINTTLWHIRSAISVAKGLSVIGSDHQYLKTKAFPANKLYEKQKHFFSTKKKRKAQRKIAKLSDATAKQLEDAEVQVCAFCLKENPPGQDKDTFEWIECEKCKCWVHEVCDYIADKANYICCMCRP